MVCDECGSKVEGDNISHARHIAKRNEWYKVAIPNPSKPERLDFCTVECEDRFTGANYK